MHHLNFKGIAALAAAALVANSAAIALDIKMYSGQADTVFSANQTIVGASAPGAKVTINGAEPVCNAVGSFAYKLALQPGDNKVEITAEKDGQSANKSFSIFRAEPKPKAAKGAKPKADATFSTPFFVASKPRAYLQYGNGDDRLGGSKMGFIAPDIPLKVVGESDNLYKVALSSNRWAYIPQSYAEPTDKVAAPVVTGSWSVSNQGKFDRVSVSLPARLPYYSYTRLDPSTIEIELYGAMDNSNWMVQRSMELGMVDYVYFEQPESDVYKVVIRMKEKYQWGYSIDYQGNTLCIDVRHSPADLSIKGVLIGLDAGHGGEYPGAFSPSGLSEKEVNLDIILRLRDLIVKAGGNVVLTRDGDTGPSMAERKRIWKEAGVDLAVSVHNNWTSDPFSAPGTSAYYKHLFDRPLAQALLGRMLETGLNLYGLTGNFNFSLNGPTDYPNALIEAMFMNSLQEEELLATPEFRQKVAEKIFAGLQDYLKAANSAKSKK
ncbi:MAG: N-acetylmuramoyl-L-alanine amidase [Clostridium sp.]|nr:N-acetylmuramoyl-L-alanine amidase [Clostridium sp.]